MVVRKLYENYYRIITFHLKILCIVMMRNFANLTADTQCRFN